MVRGEDEQVPLAQEREPPGDRLVDVPQRLGEPDDVLAVSVGLVRLDEVGGHQTMVEVTQERARLFQRDGVGRARVRVGEAATGEEVRDLAHRVGGDTRPVDDVDVARRRRVDSEVAATRGTTEGSRFAREGPGDDTSDRVRTVHETSHPFADLVQLRFGHHIDMGRELEDRVDRRVEDQLAGPEVVCPVVLERRDALVRRVAAAPSTGRHLDLRQDTGRESVRVGRQRVRRDDAEQLPVPGGRVLARTHRVKTAVDGSGAQRGRDPEQVADVAQAEPRQSRELQSTDRLGEMDERVGVGVPVGVGVRGRPGTAGVHHDDERTPASIGCRVHAAGARSFRDMSNGRKYRASMARNCSFGANMSMTNSPPNA